MLTTFGTAMNCPVLSFVHFHGIYYTRLFYYAMHFCVFYDVFLRQAGKGIQVGGMLFWKSTIGQISTAVRNMRPAITSKRSASLFNSKKKAAQERSGAA